jgi:hypothetical protein
MSGAISLLYPKMHSRNTSIDSSSLGAIFWDLCAFIPGELTSWSLQQIFLGWKVWYADQFLKNTKSTLNHRSEEDATLGSKGMDAWGFARRNSCWILSPILVSPAGNISAFDALAGLNCVYLPVVTWWLDEERLSAISMRWRSKGSAGDKVPR